MKYELINNLLINHIEKENDKWIKKAHKMLYKQTIKNRKQPQAEELKLIINLLELKEIIKKEYEEIIKLNRRLNNENQI